MDTPKVLTRSETTIAKVLAAAETLFLERNYAEVTMDQIAFASRVTKGGLYHHFASKEELYLEMMHRDLDAKRALFGRAIASGRGCRERLRLLTKAFLDLPRYKRDLIMLVRRDVNVFAEPVRTELIRAYQASLPELVEQVIDDGIREGRVAVGNARLLSWHFVAAVEVTLSEFGDETIPDTDARLNHVLDFFFHGAGTPPQDQPRS